jgi:hypothetical protein
MKADLTIIPAPKRVPVFGIASYDKLNKKKKKRPYW